MKLSEAILLGSTMSEQCWNLLSLQFTDGRIATCALGSAALAIGDLSYIAIERAYPWMEEIPSNCPECGPSFSMCVYGIISHLNDQHRWTRERIAEWVATIEPPDEPADAAVTREREAEAVETKEAPCTVRTILKNR